MGSNCCWSPLDAWRSAVAAAAAAAAAAVDSKGLYREKESTGEEYQ